MIWPSKVGMVGLSIKKNRLSNSSQKNSKKGFTLVELIVVLVVLAILAAAIVPALLGYTDYAKNKKYKATAEACLKASQTVLSDRYNDPSTNLTQAQRYAAATMADVNPEGTKFTIWTQNQLVDYDNPNGVTLADAVSSNIGAYTIKYALFETGIVDSSNPDDSTKFVFYDGNEWEVYDDLDDAEYALSQKGLVRDANTKNIVYMWPHGDDNIYVADRPEDWKDGEGGGIVKKTVTFYLTHYGYEHGVVLKDEDDNQSDKNSFQVTFTKNENTNPVSDQCSSLVEDSAIIDEENNSFTIDVEDGFKDLLWSTEAGKAGTLVWDGENNNSLLEEIFNNNVEAFYATTDKIVTTKTAIFKAYNIQTLSFGTERKDQVEITFNSYLNKYDYGNYDATLAGINKRDFTGLSDEFGNLAAQLNTPTQFYNVGWAYTYPVPLANGDKYQMQTAPLDNQAYEYKDIEEIWKKVFDSKEDNPVFTGIMIDGKKVNLYADENTAFGPSDLSKLSLEVSRNELLGADSDIDTFGTYDANKIKVTKDGKRFVGFSLSKGSKELQFYNDNIVAIKDYLTQGSVRELNLYAVTKDASQTLIKGASGQATDYPIWNVLQNLSYGNKANIVSFQRVEYNAAVEDLTGKGIFNTYTIDDNGEIKGDINVSTGRVKSGSHYAVFNAGSGISRFAIVWDGVDDKYPVPMFAYSVSDGNGGYNVYWFTDDESPEVDGGLFKLFSGCTRCDFTGSCLDEWNYSGCKSTEQMFLGCKALTSNAVSFRAWDLSSVTTIANMFDGCDNAAFTTVDFSDADMASVTSMSKWLNGCTNVSSIIFDNLNTPSLVTVTNYTYNKNALTSFSGRNWNAQSVTSLEGMFQSCPSLATVNLSGANFSSATTAKNMFQASADENTYYYVQSISLEGADLSSLKNMEQMFQHQKELTYLNLETSAPLQPEICKKTFDQCWALKKIIGIEKMDTSNVTSMVNMFYRCESLEDASFLREFDYSHVQDMTKMLMGTKFKSIDFSNVDGSPKEMPALKNVQYLFGGVGTDGNTFNSEVEYISFKNCKMTANGISYLNTLFGYCPKLKTIEGTGWGMPNVTNISSLFENVPVQDLYLVDCDMSSATNIQKLFLNCGSDVEFNLHAKGWKLSSIGSANSMFANSKLTSVDMRGCNMSNIDSAKLMFKGSTKLSTVDMTGWITTKVTSYESTFDGCTSLREVKMDLYSTNTSDTIKFPMNKMFNGCSSLEKVDFGNLETKRITTINLIFNGCKSYTFTQLQNTVKKWDLTNVPDFFKSYKGDSNNSGWNTLFAKDNCHSSMKSDHKLIIKNDNNEGVFELDWNFATDQAGRERRLNIYDPSTD